MAEPWGTVTLLNRIPTIWLVVPSAPNSRSELVNDTAPLLIASSASPDEALTWEVTVTGAPKVGVGVLVAVGVGVRLAVGVDVSVAIGVDVDVGLAVWEGVIVAVVVGTPVSVGVGEDVFVGTAVTVGVRVVVGVAVAVGVGGIGVPHCE